ELLTARLIDAEKTARRAQLDRRLYAALPYSVPVRLAGRAELLRAAEERLMTISPRHLLVTGGQGIGKTMFVQELIRRQIASETLDSLVWIDEPRSAEYARQRITEALLRESGEISLRDYVLMYDVAVVIDGMGAAAADWTEFNELLRDLGAALVVVVNQSYVPVEGVEAHIALPELDEQTAEALLRDLLRGNSMQYSSEIAHALYEHSGGNPLALRLSAGLFDAGEDWTTAKHDLHERLFERLFGRIDLQARRSWCALALFPKEATGDVLARVWGISPEVMTGLRRHGLLENSREEAYELVSSAREFIRQEYGVRSEVRRLVDSLIDEISDVDSAFEVIERALETGFPETGVERRSEWIQRLWREGLRRNHWALWRVILETYIAESNDAAAEIRIAYGLCLRHLSDWKAAEAVFQNVVTESGRTGRFDAQAQALIEWSILAKYQGKYQQAQEMNAQAKRYAQRVQDSKLLHGLMLQEAELLIQQKQGTEALHILRGLPKTVRLLVLQSEAQLALSNYEACRSLAAEALHAISEDQVTEASLYTIIGRSFQAQGDTAQAQRFFSDAVTLLERLGDSFALARAQTNLAATLIAIRRILDAAELLRRAEQMQVQLGDRIGLNVTRHNRTLLGGYFAD
ncbi:MAG: tetratricopeptide repeat protein, partial [Chloroflexota bacterium]